VTLVFLFALAFVPVAVVLAVLLVPVRSLLFGLHAKPR
jgi:predicted branched-subunit amino acid permease